MSWFYFKHDITWCISECNHIDCFRHIRNRRFFINTGGGGEGDNIFTAGELKGTEYCFYREEMNHDA